MHGDDLVHGRLPITAEKNLRAKRHPRNRKLPGWIFTHDPDCLVSVVFNDEASLCCNGQKPQHVATRQTGDEGFFRIDRLHDGERDGDDVRRGRSGNFESTVEQPAMPAAVPIVAKGNTISAPDYDGLVLDHGYFAVGSRRVTLRTLPSSWGRPGISMTGRISMVPKRAAGIRSAIPIASSRFPASIRK